MNFKQQAAQACLQFIKPGLTIGFGAGSTIAYLVDFIRAESKLVDSVTFVSSSFLTRAYLLQNGLNVKTAVMASSIDIYFDGCDQFDAQLNAMKTGGGIHTTEKILATMASQFILVGDAGKFVPQLDATYPLVVEVIPEAQTVVFNKLQAYFPEAIIKLRISGDKDGAVVSDNGNLLADLRFTELPELSELNSVKMIPGVVDHSLFYKMADKAIVAGPDGVQIITPILS